MSVLLFTKHGSAHSICHGGATTVPEGVQSYVRPAREPGGLSTDLGSPAFHERQDRGLALLRSLAEPPPVEDAASSAWKRPAVTRAPIDLQAAYVTVNARRASHNAPQTPRVSQRTRSGRSAQQPYHHSHAQRSHRTGDPSPSASPKAAGAHRPAKISSRLVNWKPQFWPLVIPFMVVLISVGWFTEPYAGLMGWPLTILWSWPIASTVVGVRGIARTRRVIKRSRKRWRKGAAVT